jgi:hypothetical protein
MIPLCLRACAEGNPHLCTFRHLDFGVGTENLFPHPLHSLFSDEDDEHLIDYLAHRIPVKEHGGRSGQKVYKELLDHVRGITTTLDLRLYAILRRGYIRGQSATLGPVGWSDTKREPWTLTSG